MKNNWVAVVWILVYLRGLLMCANVYKVREI